MLPKKSETEATSEKNRTTAEQNIKQLEDLYFGNKLHYGNSLKGVYTEVLGTKIEPGSDYARYQNTLMSMRPTFAKAAGDVGNIALQEQIQAGKIFPTARYGRAQAVKMFTKARKKFGLSPRTYGEIYGSSNISNFASQYE